MRTIIAAVGTLHVYGGDVYTPFDVIAKGAVFARGGIIERVGRHAEIGVERADVEVDTRGGIICPGFVDLQVNGGGGALLTEEPRVDSVARIAAAHVRFGTTSMLPAIVTSDEATMARALGAVAESMAHPPPGARVLGSHLEGPFINPAHKGAHAERFIQPPRPDLFARLREASKSSLRLVTLAPELPGARALIDAARQESVVVAIGHTQASFEETQSALEAGVSLGTHLFNGMPGLGHRGPGVVGALLQDDRVVVSIIADAVHVHPAVLALVARAKGPERIALVTDAMPPVGTDVPSFRFQGEEVRVRDGACYAAGGTLVGSTLSMNQAIRTMNRLAGVPLCDCIEMATATPARVLGLEGEIGALKPGARADIVVCDPDLNVSKVFVGGGLAYEGQ